MEKKYYAIIGFNGGKHITEITDTEYDFHQRWGYNFDRHTKLSTPHGEIFVNNVDFIQFIEEEIE